MLQKGVWDESSGWATIKKKKNSRIDSEAWKQSWSKTNSCCCWAVSSLLQLAAWAGLTLQCSHTHPEKGVLLGRERSEQEKMHNLELGWTDWWASWMGHWSAWCRWSCLPTSSHSSSCGLGCALCPSSLGLQIHKMLLSVSFQVYYCQGKMLQGKQLLTVSPGAPASPRAPFSPFAPCAERRDTSWLDMGGDLLPDKKPSRCLNVY